MANETKKLVNVLRRIARASGYAAWAKSEPQAARFCAGQYNRVLARLKEIEPGIDPLFSSLPEETPPEVTRIAAKHLAAYFEDEAAPESFAWGFGGHCRPGGRVRVHVGPSVVHCD